MTNINSKLYQVYLSLLGYKKVPLRDSRGVLNSSNNFKYYKESFLHYNSKTILPSGTKITYKVDDMDYSSHSKIKEYIIIKKFSGNVISMVREIVQKRKEIFINKKLFAVIDEKKSL